ncbi:MAG: hypothetical protein KDI79_09975 [Anaerolineae bacterium]|nr:hypothetical protein [Anaerolineae bacterium]
MVIEEHLPLLEDLLGLWQTKIGPDYTGYKNHVYRMVNFCFALHNGNVEARQKIIIAGCFHDLGIWASDTFDYLPPSIALAKAYLEENQQAAWIPEIELMISEHHKLRRYRDARYPLVEVFRQGDLVDFSLGLVTCGLPRSDISSVKRRWPNAGFHKRLVQLELGWLSDHPLNPAPVFKW